MTLVTVVIPARDRSNLLREALDSVRAQTYRDFVACVFDNNSSEDIAGLVASLRDERFKAHRHHQPIGMAANWKFSLTAPKTKYVAWLHDDDLWAPEHLANAVRELESRPEANLYSCAVQHFSADGPQELQAVSVFREVTEPVAVPPQQTLRLWLRRHQTQCSAVVFRRSALEGLFWGPVGLQRTLDVLIIGQVALSGKWIYDPRCTASYRIHSAMLSVEHTKRGRSVNAQAAYVQRYLAELAVRRGEFDCDALLVEAGGWPVVNRAAIAAVFTAWGSSGALRRCGRALLCRYPDILNSPETTRSCRVASHVGSWYLIIAEYVNRFAAMWWPRGAQAERR